MKICLIDHSNKSNGGTEIQYRFLKQYVDKSLLNLVELKLLPNTNNFAGMLDVIYNQQRSIAWTHQVDYFPEALHLSKKIDNLAKIVFVSNWQQQRYFQRFNIPAEKSTVIQNGIEPQKLHKKPLGKKNIVYFSTPYRGLEVLLDSLNYISSNNYHLHVFSSMDIYGQSERNLEFERLYEKCKKNHKITYYGFVKHSELLSALSEMHIHSYPSIFEETSCLAVLESMSQQIKVVCSNLGALPETTAGFANIYPYTSDKVTHSKIHAKLLEKEIESLDESNLNLQKQYVDTLYDWKKIKVKWENLIKNVVECDNLNLSY